MAQKATDSEAWLAFQLLRKSTKIPPATPSCIVPNWARFFRIKADRSVASPTATVADRLNWAKLTTKTHK
eukprot:4525527-Pyramimonas_sp.AAC.1